MFAVKVFTYRIVVYIFAKATRANPILHCRRHGVSFRVLVGHWPVRVFLFSQFGLVSLHGYACWGEIISYQNTLKTRGISRQTARNNREKTRRPETVV